MDQDDPVYTGYLLFPPHGNVLNKITKKKPWQQKYCMLFNSSKQGIERLEIYDNLEDVTTASYHRIIDLKNCIKIKHTNPNTITIITKELNQHLSAINDEESLRWVTALQSVAFKDDVSKRVSIDEDNDLYCSSDEGRFLVKLCASDASNRCGFEPANYTLLITTTGIELKDLKDKTHFATWPFKYIRRYGYRHNKFSFEGGRKCQTGEGTFHFEHSNQQDIFRCVSSKIKSMKKKMSGESLTPIDSGDHPAINMEPRSRSPFPLLAMPEDLSFSSKSSANLSVDSQTLLIESAPKLGIKHKPVKPPRKHIFSIAKEKHEQEMMGDNADSGKYKQFDSYETISTVRTTIESDNFVPPYDEVEVTNDAWKSRGLNEIDHQEFPHQKMTNNNCKRLISRSQDNLDSFGSGDSPKIIHFHDNDVDPRDAAYDRLEYFGSAKHKRSDVYNVVARPPTAHNPSGSKETWNDYDEVENVMQSVRLADDSYLGYGKVRIPSQPGPQVPNKSKVVSTSNNENVSTYSNIDHYQNGGEYALISKPRRV